MTSNYYDDLFKITKEIHDSLKIFEDIKPIYEMTKSLKGMYEPFGSMMKLHKSEMIFVKETHKIQKMFRDADIKKLLGVPEQLKTLYSVDISGMSKSLRQFADAEFLQEFKNFSTMSKLYDSQKLTRIMQDSLNQIDWSQDVSMDEVTKEVAEQYIEEELAEQAEDNDSNVQNIQIDKKQIKKDIEGVVSFWIGIVSLLLTIYGLVNSKPTVVYNTYNNTTEVNYDYTVDMGIDAELMNNLGYRIINQNNVMPRIKPNYSSKVTGHLYIGQVVNISDKYKKWIEITWKDDEGNNCFGWVQSYKVSKFK